MPDPQPQGSTTTTGTPTLYDGLTQFLEAKAKGDDSGNYRRNAKRVITRWIDWLDQRDIERFEQLDETVLAHYAEHLRRRVAANEAETTDAGIASSTAWTYYNTISAFLGWASKWDYLQENYARAGLAQESMPDRSTSQQSQQQFWTPEQRTQILDYVNERAHDAIDEKGLDADVEARDRALVAVLAFTGVRASEVFRSEHDNRTGRQGIRWRDINLEEQTISVLGKNQQRQSAWLLEQALPSVERYRTISDPPTDDWPVFPTKHAPSLYQCARTHLREVGGEGKESIEAILDENPIEEVLREYGIVPPAITTNGARSVMKQLCEAADLDILTPPEGPGYLQLHGARRGIGDTFYRMDRGTAQDLMRHQSLETTKDHYSHIDATEGAKRASEMLDESKADQ
ncbi:tyrosine-type recombinase/integrase [Halalkalicoccus jeotgali]|uniref:Integrase family protein n=1 Tax=Halalkalicoccus jeotgali (strain DSM 18796 / CECT 7217 / JCM 14584 / KCTC 4019 / B3) TaxID=795797 RepID=D8JB47_HALJB|nr:site-specific integrase [Halalkalicoccus jeotgali]ADJ16500.1 integrase family protein [Halalkalicoccus jeotgali B3]ELY41404.1 integrase family protein [Halalkalicoccus jeotgali B3]